MKNYTLLYIVTATLCAHFTINAGIISKSITIENGSERLKMKVSWLNRDEKEKKSAIIIAPEETIAINTDSDCHKNIQILIDDSPVFRFEYTGLKDQCKDKKIRIRDIKFRPTSTIAEQTEITSNTDCKLIILGTEPQTITLKKSVPFYLE